MNGPRRTAPGEPVANGEAPADFELFIVVIGLCALWLGWVSSIWQPLVPALCPVREIMGVACPTCGGTRAWLAVARGEWGAAVAFNPVVGLGGISLVLYLPWAAAAVVGGWGRPRPVIRVGWEIRAVVIGALLANWIWVALRF